MSRVDTPAAASSLRTSVLSNGYTPARRDLDAVLHLLGDDNETISDAAAKALLRSGAEAARAARTRFEASVPPLRARICALVGRIAASTPTLDTELVEWLMTRLDDSDSVTRRRAATALGKLGSSPALSRVESSGKPVDVSIDALVALASVEAALLTAWGRATTPVERKPIAMALGNAGSARALAALKAYTPSDPPDRELSRVVGEAVQKLRRSKARAKPTTIDASSVPPSKVPVLLHVRAGLEPILLDELAGLGFSEPPPRMVGRGRVLLELDVPIERLFSARTFLHFAFVLPSAVIGAIPRQRSTEGAARDEKPVDDDALLRAAVQVIAGDHAAALFTAFTRGPVRYRIDWIGAGHRRALTYRIADAVTQKRPDLRNDPREAPWEVTLSAHQGTSENGANVLHAELWPTAVVDPRFVYRERTVPASSHPTIAAALAHVAGVEANDVVWDPFVGAGAELVERALRGPYARLYGSDRDESALEAAKQNLAAAHLERVDLALGDARTFRPPEPVSLVITNPPMGRRVSDRTNVQPLLLATLRNAASALRPGGRLVWMCPEPRACLEVAADLGFTVADRRILDMGGFDAEMQVLRLGGSPSPRSRLATPRGRA